MGDTGGLQRGGGAQRRERDDGDDADRDRDRECGDRYSVAASVAASVADRGLALEHRVVLESVAGARRGASVPPVPSGAIAPSTHVRC